MYKGTRQGGGGSEFVTLTGLFPTRRNTGFVGFVSQDAFTTLKNLLRDCEDADVDLLVFVQPNRDRDPESRVWGRLLVTLGTPRESRNTNRRGPARHYGDAPEASRGAGRGRGALRSSEVYGTNRQQSAPRLRKQEAIPEEAAERVGTTPSKQNPPKDPLDDFLENFNEHE